MSESCDCGEDAKLGATVKLHCQTCKTVKRKISINKPLKVAAIMAILTYSGSQFIDYAITDNRYPLSTEYELLETCVASSKRPLRTRNYNGKKQVCLCALEETMNEISHLLYIANERRFLDAFTRNARECK